MKSDEYPITKNSFLRIMMVLRDISTGDVIWRGSKDETVQPTHLTFDATTSEVDFETPNRICRNCKVTQELLFRSETIEKWDFNINVIQPNNGYSWQCLFEINSNNPTTIACVLNGQVSVESKFMVDDYLLSSTSDRLAMTNPMQDPPAMDIGFVNESSTVSRSTSSKILSCSAAFQQMQVIPHYVTAIEAEQSQEVEPAQDHQQVEQVVAEAQHKAEQAFLTAYQQVLRQVQLYEKLIKESLDEIDPALEKALETDILAVLKQLKVMHLWFEETFQKGIGATGNPIDKVMIQVIKFIINNKQPISRRVEIVIFMLRSLISKVSGFTTMKKPNEIIHSKTPAQMNIVDQVATESPAAAVPMHVSSGELPVNETMANATSHTPNNTEDETPIYSDVMIIQEMKEMTDEDWNSFFDSFGV